MYHSSFPSSSSSSYILIYPQFRSIKCAPLASAILAAKRASSGSLVAIYKKVVVVVVVVVVVAVVPYDSRR